MGAGQTRFAYVPSYLEVNNGKVGGKIPVSEYYSLREMSVKNPDAASITLGKYTNGPDSYIARAGTTSSYFDMGSEWGKIQNLYHLSDEEMFNYFNKPALDDAISSNQVIRFSHNPLDFSGSFLEDEWNYIKQELGIFENNLVYEGGFWYVK